MDRKDVFASISMLVALGVYLVSPIWSVYVLVFALGVLAVWRVVL